ncbi:MAG: hypothetical protein AAGN82_16515 [Myxococcota bacterium]
MKAYLFVLSAALGWGCGGQAIIDGSGGGGGATASTTSGGGGDVVVTTTTGAPDPSTTSGGPQGPFDISVLSAFGAANCAPIIAPDPMSMEIELLVDNSANDQALALVVDQVSIESTASTTRSVFAVDSSQPPLIPAFTEGVLSFEKVPNSLGGTEGSACVWCDLMELQFAVLVVEGVAGGMPFTAEGRVDSYSCVF